MNENMGVLLPEKRETFFWNQINGVISLEGLHRDRKYILITNSVHLNVSKTHQNQDRIQYAVELTPSLFKEVELLQLCFVVLTSQRKFNSILGEVRTDIFSHYGVQRNGYSKTEIFQKSKQLCNSVSIHSSGQKALECCLYVTKFWKQVEEEDYSTKMFHEQVWSPEQIEFVMKQVELGVGSFDGLVQNRRYLIFSFKRGKQDPFWSKWSDLKRQILIGRKGIDGSKICYYVWSKECMLTSQQTTITLFQLPNICKIVQVGLHSPWAVIAAQKYVLFIHIYKPMDYFKHQENISPTKIKYLPNSQALLILDKQGYIFCFKTSDKEILLLKKMETSFLRPYAVAEIGESVFLAGLDIDKKDNKKASLKRRVYRLGKNVLNPMLVSQEATYENHFEVALVPKDKPLTPLSQLETVSKQLLACSCDNNFYLINLEGHRLIEVQLKSNITRIIPVPFLFNIFNFIVLNSQGQLIRMGVESYGTTLGSQVQKMGSEIIDCSFCLGPGSQYEVVVAGWKEISKRSYLKNDWNVILREEKGQIVHLTSDETGIAFLVDLEHSYQLRYLQL